MFLDSDSPHHLIPIFVPSSCTHPSSLSILTPQCSSPSAVISAQKLWGSLSKPRLCPTVRHLKGFLPPSCKNHTHNYPTALSLLALSEHSNFTSISWILSFPLCNPKFQCSFNLCHLCQYLLLQGLLLLPETHSHNLSWPTHPTLKSFLWLHLY